MIPCFGDHHAAIGVSHENRGIVLSVEDEPRRRHVIGQRGGRILDDADAVAISRENSVDTLPTRTVYETTVNENYVNGLVPRHDDVLLAPEGTRTVIVRPMADAGRVLTVTSVLASARGRCPPTDGARHASGPTGLHAQAAVAEVLE